MIGFSDGRATAPSAKTRLQDCLPATSVYGAPRESIAWHADPSALAFLPVGDPAATRSVSYCALLQGIAQAANVFARWG